MLYLYLYAIPTRCVFPIFSHKAEYFGANRRPVRIAPNSIWISLYEQQ